MSAPPVFITARFRSGSTMLWLLAKKLPDAVAFYEPCHDNLLEHVRGGTPPQDSHPGVESYWEEYGPILDGLALRHENAFGVDRLLLEAGDEHSAFEGYIRFLMDSCGGRQPVLQFNRVDFRLPWLRARFPEVKIIHLHRDPVSQWLSMVRDVPLEKRSDPELETDYELSTWAFSLSGQLPFLLGPHIRHPYQRHYLLWKLSLLMGRRCADASVAFEDLVSGDEAAFERLLAAFGRNAASGAAARAAVMSPRPAATDDQERSSYARLSAECDRLLGELGLEESFGLRPLEEIQAARRAAWAPYFESAAQARTGFFARAYSRLRSRYLETVTALRRSGELSRSEAALRVQEIARRVSLESELKRVGR